MTEFTPLQVASLHNQVGAQTAVTISHAFLQKQITISLKTTKQTKQKTTTYLEQSECYCNNILTYPHKKGWDINYPLHFWE